MDKIEERDYGGKRVEINRLHCTCRCNVTENRKEEREGERETQKKRWKITR